MDNTTPGELNLCSNEGHERDHGRWYASLAHKVIANGYTAVPVEPSKVAPNNFPDWYRFSWRNMNSEETKLYANEYCDHGLAIGCGFRTVAIDIDSEDKYQSEELASAAEDIFTKTPLIRIGREPHIALVYACAEPIISYRLPSLEILGLGRYLTCFGIHPETGRPYKWVQESSPANTPVSALPRITQSSIDLYIKTVSPILQINYEQVSFNTWREEIEGLLSSRTQLIKQLALTAFKGKSAARSRARELLWRGLLCFPVFRLGPGPLLTCQTRGTRSLASRLKSILPHSGGVFRS